MPAVPGWESQSERVPHGRGEVHRRGGTSSCGTGPRVRIKEGGIELSGWNQGLLPAPGHP